MIHTTYGQTATFYTTTLEKRINNTVPTNQLRYLCKFTNDLSGSVVYGYGQNELLNDRYTRFTMPHNLTQNVYTGEIDFKPNGYWTYEIFEVSWISSSIVLGSGTAPINETDVLSPVADTKGVVQGSVELGKLYVKEPSGEEEVQYTEYNEPASTNYIYVS
tara:strand:- start:190 stop:672 length:483 start_codon:yes stop_codon:yes gene_type:complete